MKRFLYELSLTTISLVLFSQSNFAKTPLFITVCSFYAFLLISILTMYLTSPVESKLLTQLITTTKERNRVRFWLITILNISLIVVAAEPYILSKYKLYTPPFYEFNNNIGYVACGVLLFSFLLLPVFKILRFNGRVDKYVSHLKDKEILHKEFEIKAFTLHRKIIVWSAKQLRRFHIPIALGGILFVFTHVYMSLISGFKVNYTYISGYAGLLDILVLSLLGLLRFKHADKNLHKNLTYILILLLVLHIIASELRL